ncbi:MAG: hypothetical protein JRJ38_01935 [Deltaproteobacteria bacterium]|nr:hypothetical protein [Deltaproteobacteria bacterium]
MKKPDIKKIDRLLQYVLAVAGRDEGWNREIGFTASCLSDRALKLLDEWIEWLMTGSLGMDTKLCEIRDVLLDVS